MSPATGPALPIADRREKLYRHLVAFARDVRHQPLSPIARRIGDVLVSEAEAIESDGPERAS